MSARDHDLRRERASIEVPEGRIEPTAEEARNGWTAESLTAYVNERLAAQAVAADPASLARRHAARPTRANSHYRKLG